MAEGEMYMRKFTAARVNKIRRRAIKKTRKLIGKANPRFERFVGNHAVIVCISAQLDRIRKRYGSQIPAGMLEDILPNFLTVVPNEAQHQ